MKSYVYKNKKDLKELKNYAPSSLAARLSPLATRPTDAGEATTTPVSPIGATPTPMALTVKLTTPSHKGCNNQNQGVDLAAA